MSQILQGELPYPEHRRVVDVQVILGGGGSGSAVDPWIFMIFEMILCIDFTLEDPSGIQVICCIFAFLMNL